MKMDIPNNYFHSNNSSHSSFHGNRIQGRDSQYDAGIQDGGYDDYYGDGDYGNGSYEDYYDGYYGGFLDYDYPEDKATTTLNYVAPPVLLLLGVTTNILSCVVMSKLTSKTLSTCVNLAILSVCDILLLINRCGSVWVTQITNADYDVMMVFVSKSNEFCQVYSFLSNLIIHWCSWLLAVALAECCLFTRRPLQLHKLATRERSKNTLLFILLLSIVVNAHYFWTYGLQEEYYIKGTFWCQFTTIGSYYSESFRKYLWPVLDLLMATLLPGGVMLFCVADIVRIRWGCCNVCCCFTKNRKKISNMREEEESGRFTHCACANSPEVATMLDKNSMSQKKRKQKRVTFYDNGYLLDAESCDTFVVMCLVLAVYCCILALPETVFSYIVDFLIIERLGYVSDSFRFESKRRLGRTLCAMFRDILLSSKILIYLLWPTFRRTLKELFCCKTREHQLLMEIDPRCNGCLETEPPSGGHQGGYQGRQPFAMDTRNNGSNAITVV